MDKSTITPQDKRSAAATQPEYVTEDLMQRVRTTRSTHQAALPASARRNRATLIAISALASLVLAGCTSASKGSASTDASTAGGSGAPAAASSTASKDAAPGAIITTSSAGHAISPVKPVSVAIAHGTLTSVKMVNPAGKTVAGVMAADGKSWHSTEDLGYSKTYRISATGKNADGAPVSKQAKVTTLTPGNQTTPYLQRIGGYTLENGATYGVAIVPVIHFDEAITHEKAAQAALQITTSPHVNGSWYWSDNQNAHWRPEHYWASGTKVTISANVYGVQVGGNLFGSTNVSASFKIGAKQITVADDNAPKSVNKVRVYHEGKLVRTMNTSMGKHSGQDVGGQHISFYTMEGTYTVLEHDNPAIMSSQSYGLPASAPGGYAPEKIYYSTKISTDGIYLHELDNTAYAQNNGVDVSHGCLNLVKSNAVWFYQHSQIGDPVQIRHTHGPTIDVWQGGDWSVPWSTWVKGSATS